MSARYEFIDGEENATDANGQKMYRVVKMCEWLEGSCSGYYEWRDRPCSATAQRRERLKLLITKTFSDSDGTYGYRRIHAQLARWSVHCTPELVRALMRLLYLVACHPRPWRHSLTQAAGQPAQLPDLVRRDFTADVPGTKMVGDITYIPTWEGWLFSAAVIDCHTKAVIGWATGDNYKTPLISAAVDMAMRNHDIAPEATFHSDRGSNYTSAEFAATLAGQNLRPSVGRTGICYDNALAESFFAASGCIAPSTRQENTPAKTSSVTSNFTTTPDGCIQAWTTGRHAKSTTSTFAGIQQHKKPQASYSGEMQGGPLHGTGTTSR